MTNDPAVVVHRLELLARTADKIRRHIVDLHCLAWEPHSGEDTDRVRGGTTDRAPRSGDPRARRLYDRVAVDVAQMSAELVGYEREMTRLFVAGTAGAESSRGSLISAGEHDRLLANQRTRTAAGEYTPQRLADQPSHPGKAK